MNRVSIRLVTTVVTIALFAAAVSLAGYFPASSDSTSVTQIAAPAQTSAYRSPAPFHKVLVPVDEPARRDALLAAGGRLLAEYDAFSLLQAPAEATAALLAAGTGTGETTGESTAAAVRDDMNLLLLRAGAFDTLQPEAQALRVRDAAEPAAEQLFLVQMIGPVKDEWLAALDDLADIVSYVPNNAYLVRATHEAMAQIRALQASPQSFIQWAGDYQPAYKLAPELPLDTDATVTITVQLADSLQTAAQLERLAMLADGALDTEVASVAGYTNARLQISAARLADIARLNDVVWVEPYDVPVMMDEKQSLIVSGNFTGQQLSNPGYLAWLRSKRLDTTPDFIVDVADTGIDRGSLDPEVIHPDFLNAAGLSRVVYAKLHSSSNIDGTSQDISGHGTLDASIVGGYNVGTAYPMIDNNGYSFGVGVHPFVKLGVSKVFNPEFTNPNYVSLVDTMYKDGARISTNSWGAYNNSYTVDSQTYDSLVRDAQRGAAGNQQLSIIFAVGNEGPIGRLSSPANGKNLLTVGASENMRPGIDGCGIGDTGADDPLSIISFSSGGLTTDGRRKPEIVAPGTHIQGALSQDRGFLPGGICGPKFYPVDQSFYTWSSGTSHAAPAVAGGAALVRQFFQQSTGQAPSPAMIKAFLTNSTTYMTGNLAADSLPGRHQGFGLMNLGRAFDDARRLLIDQTQVLGNTGESFVVKGQVVDVSKPFRVTLVWTDAPGTPAANPVVNNLDLQVIINGNTYLGNRFSGSTSTAGGAADNLNNTEAVWLPTGTGGEFEVRVVAANLTGDGVPGNNDTTDQDFALVIYNAQEQTANEGPIDSPPVVILRSPVGGETVTVGNTLRIQWDASDDKGVQSQRVEFSSNDGATYDTIATLTGNVRFFDWRIPSLPTTRARIRVSALDGVNLASSSFSPLPFTIITGPTDTTPPQLSILSPTGDMTLGGGTKTSIRWRESDNIGVLRRVLEYSGDGGDNFQVMATLVAPSSGETQSFEWEIPVGLTTNRGRIRVTIFDGAGNSVSVLSPGKFQIWGLPVITEAVFIPATETERARLEIYGRQFRQGDTDIFVDGVALKKLKFEDRCSGDDGRCKKITSVDKKILKRLPEGVFVDLEVKLGATGQVSPKFQFKRKRIKPGQQT